MAEPAPSREEDWPDEALSYRTDPQERAAFIAAVEEAIVEADAGLGRPLEDLIPWLLSWGKEGELPPPE